MYLQVKLAVLSDTSRQCVQHYQQLSRLALLNLVSTSKQTVCVIRPLY